MSQDIWNIWVHINKHFLTKAIIVLSHLRGVLVSLSCCNKVPQTGLLHTTEIYSFTLCEVGSWELSLKALEDNLFHAFLLASGVAGKSWHSLSYRHITLVTAPLPHGILIVRLCISSLLVKIPVIFDLGPTLLQYDLIVTWLHQQRPDFQMKSQSQIRRFRI